MGTEITGSSLRNLPREPARLATFAIASPGDVFPRPAQLLHRQEATEDLPSSFRRRPVHGPLEDCPSKSHSQRSTSQRSTWSNFGNDQAGGIQSISNISEYSFPGHPILYLSATTFSGDTKM